MVTSLRRGLHAVLAALLAVSVFIAGPAVAAETQADDEPTVAEHHGNGRGGRWRNDAGGDDDDNRGRGQRRGWRDGRGRWGNLAGFAANGDGDGFWVLTRKGEIYALGGAPQLGPVELDRDPIALAGHPSDTGYWALDDTGHVSAFGAAKDFGSADFKAVGIAVGRNGDGYWIASRSGKVRAFGAARRHGDARRDGVTVDRIVPRDDADGYFLRTTDDEWLQFPREDRPDRDRPGRDEPKRDSDKPKRDTNKPKPPSDTGSIRLTTVRGITVARSIGDDIRRLMNAADRARVRIGGWGYRSTARQIELRRAHCGRTRYAIYEMPSSQCNPPTARPGTSMHERGLAIDFYKKGRNGQAISIGGTRAFRWLKRNAHKYGLYNLPSEPWHWSTNGR